MRTTVYLSEDVPADLSAYVSRLSREAIERHGLFTVAISGGSLPKQLSRDLVQDTTVDWSKWHVFFADERCVKLDHADSNYALVKEELLDKVSIPSSQVYPIDDSVVDSPQEVASRYMDCLRGLFASKDSVKVPVFDLILLGMGPDGHTCSLFPDHPILEEDVEWVSYLTDSPKPPPSRITLTFPVLNHAKNVAFVATGAGKQEPLHRIFDLGDILPAGKVQPVTGELVWFLDEEAAKDLRGGADLQSFPRL
ncbi:MAG: glucosamine-6-phosphate isomerases/6-phosphogluconolactonase-domain-containing protein [Piptocephalis tieghemiana]|nr:MAG: glucosamine-6-phosphate isomerases/6-phosphogluconolactonase-domain-containing protein [Piptocephalis tieghemiana]